VVIDAAKIDLLRAELGRDADGDTVLFDDMAEVGRNPARIIPAWREFVSRRAGEGGAVRGIGEPIWAGRTAAEQVECQRHEALLNLAFSGAPGWWLLCPYDVDALSPEVIDEAHRTHPYILQGGQHRDSRVYLDVSPSPPFDAPLPEPDVSPDELAFVAGSLPAVRSFVAQRAANAGLRDQRTDDLVLAVNELATNSLRYGGAHGTLRVWQTDDDLVCEVRDGGRIDEPLVGREWPPTDRDGGRGLWLVNHLCDLVQIRSFPTGAVVRLVMSCAA